MLPKSVADNLRQNKTTSEMFDSATICFTEIDEFKDIARICDPLQVRYWPLIGRHNLYWPLIGCSFLICSIRCTRPSTPGSTATTCIRWSWIFCTNIFFLFLKFIFIPFIAKYSPWHEVETINDTYMVASGLPERNGNRHAAEIANLCIELMLITPGIMVPHDPSMRLKIRW